MRSLRVVTFREPCGATFDAGLNEQPCFKLMRGQNETSEVVRENVPRRSSRGVKGLKARVKRRKSAPVLAWKGASASAQLQLQPAVRAVLAIRATDTPQNSKRSLSHCAAAAASWQGRETSPKANTALLPLALQ